MSDDSKLWIERASNGDGAAVEGLLVRYLPDLVEYIDRRAAHWLQQRESAADLAQSVCREVLVRLRGGRFEYRGEPQFRQWLYRAAVIKLIERTRRGAAERRDPAREVRASAAPEPATGRGSPSETAMLHEELERFHTAFASLSERAQEIVSLKLVDGLSHAQIAARLGVSEPNSRTLLARALAQLAQRGVGA
jgi:RNA polymerase sigma-70 factor (ECF subfamily)